MSASSIVAIAVIVILSVAAVLTAEEPLDEVFHIRAAMEGFPLPPLATKVAQQSDAKMSIGNEGVCSSENLVPSPLKRTANCDGPGFPVSPGAVFKPFIISGPDDLYAMREARESLRPSAPPQ